MEPRDQVLTPSLCYLSSRLVRVSLHPSSRDMERRDQVLTPSLCYLSCRLVRVSLHPSSRDMEPRDQLLLYAHEGLAPPVKEHFLHCSLFD
jgi:hypothetical protein